MRLINKVYNMAKNQIEKEQLTELIVKNSQLPSAHYDGNFGLEKCSKFNISTVSSVGSCTAQAAKEIMAISANEGGTGLFRIALGTGEHLAKFKNKKGFLGAVFNKNGLSRQAEIIPVALDPTMMLAEIAISSITFKLIEIEENEKEIINLIKSDKKNKLNSILDELKSIMVMYETNLGNDRFINSRLSNVGNIKVTIGELINFYEDEVKKKAINTNLIINSKDVRKKLQDIIDDFNAYNLALYAYSYACYLEIVLSENYNKDNIKKYVESIEEKAGQYMQVLDNYCNKIKMLSDKSIEDKSKLVISNLGELLGVAMNKMPFIKDTEIGEQIIKASDDLYSNYTSKVNTLSLEFKTKNEPLSKIFVNSINRIDKLINDNLIVYADKDNIYLPND